MTVSRDHSPPRLRPEQVETLIEAIVGGSTFVGGVSLSQLLLYALRVSASTPLVAPAAGCLALAGSSVLAVAAASAAHELHLATRAHGGRLEDVGVADVVGAVSKVADTWTQQPPDAVGWWESWWDDDEDAAVPPPPLERRVTVAALTGAVVFVVLGGRPRSLAPSDYRHLGAFARPRQSLRAAGMDYATPAQRVAIQAVGRAHGCHTCGTRRAKYHADHMPPNKYVRQRNALWWRQLLRLRPEAQHFYPQCEGCSNTQGKVVRVDRRELCLHLGSMRLYHATGLVVPFAANAALPFATPEARQQVWEALRGARFPS